MDFKRIFAAAMICAAAALSGCSTSEPAENESSSSSQTQSSSVKPEQSSTAPKSSVISTTTSSTASSTKSQWTRSSYTVPKLPSRSSSSSSKVTPWTDAVSYPVPSHSSGSSSNAIPWTFPANPDQKRLGVTSNWSDFLGFIFTPFAVVVAVDEKGDDLVEDDMSMYMILKIPYDKIAESYFAIPVDCPVMVYGSSAHATRAYSELIKLRPDIPEITCFVVT